MGPSKAPWTDEVPLRRDHGGRPTIVNISYQGSQDQMQVSLTTFEREIDGIPQMVIVVAPLVCVRTHLPSALLLEITPLEQVNCIAKTWSNLHDLGDWRCCSLVSRGGKNLRRSVISLHSISRRRCRRSFRLVIAKCAVAVPCLNCTICRRRNPFNFPFNFRLPIENPSPRSN